jgi:FAD/FMN-containing dehydrogenase
MEAPVSEAESWEVALERLRGRSRGRVLVRGSNGYDESRRVYNAMIDRFPVLIVRCEDVDDVALAVKFAREHDLPVSIKGGGHAVSGSRLRRRGNPRHGTDRPTARC